MKIFTWGFPSGYGYIRTGIAKQYYIPVKIEPSLPDGFVPLREQDGDPIEVYNRNEALEEVQKHLQKLRRSHDGEQEASA